MSTPKATQVSPAVVSNKVTMLNCLTLAMTSSTLSTSVSLTNLGTGVSTKTPGKPLLPTTGKNKCKGHAPASIAIKKTCHGKIANRF